MFDVEKIILSLITRFKKKNEITVFIICSLIIVNCSWLKVTHKK